MANVFLGKWWHWMVLVGVCVILWYAGERRLHVVYFNWFVLGLIGLVGIVLVLILRTTAPGEQVTRDRIGGVTD